MLIDSHGRHIHKLRVSLLDACNFKCTYCMPEEHPFMDRSCLMSTSEIIELCTNLTQWGIDEIRLTGGEPTLRSDFIDIAQSLSELPLRKFGVTTNGKNIKKLLPRLKSTRCHYLNFSLDSLNKEKFRQITKSDSFDQVLSSILMASDMGFQVKINTVLMKGVNDDELFEFVNFSKKYNITVRFLEVMNIGVVRPYFKLWFISADEAIERIQKNYNLKSKKMAQDSTSFNYEVEGGGEIGFIASESRPFCHSCSRLRINAKGELRPCLMLDHGVSLRGVKFSDYPKLLKGILELKPTQRLEENERPMYQMGG